MARTQLGAALTQAHRQQLEALKAATIRDLLKLYPAWHLDDPASYDRLVQIVNLLIRERRGTAAGLAAQYYQAFRLAEQLPGIPVQAVMAVPVGLEQTTAMVNATARAGVGNALAAGKSQEAAMRNGFVRLSGSVSRSVLDGSRQTIIGTGKRDSRFHGWMRITGADPCAFCAMVASRGPVYWSEDSAGFESHDHCDCGAELAADGSDWPDASKAFREQWNSTTAGYSGNDALNAFRRARGGSSDDE